MSNFKRYIYITFSLIQQQSLYFERNVHVDEHLHNFFKSSELDFLMHLQEIDCSIIFMHFREFGVTLSIIFFALLSWQIILLGH